MREVAGARYLFHGHAIVSANDRIADATGMTPDALRIEADWVRFQAALDQAAVIILGRLGHEANPNRRRRNRLVLSSHARRIARRDGAWWWNPAEASLEEALVAAAPDGGIAAVPGGRRVFDLFLDLGYDAFHLTRAADVRIAGGIPVFSAVRPGTTADGILSGAGLRADPPIGIDEGVRLTVWRKP